MARRLLVARRMLVSIPSAALYGVDAYRVDVEIDVAGGLPQYLLVGLAATSIKEGASRIRSALKNCGHPMPSSKVTVNLAPADRRKDGAAFDLPIAIGILIGGELEAPCPAIDGLLVMGELGLDGSVRAVPGVLSAAILARAHGLRGVLVPSSCAAEAAMVDGIEVYAIGHLSQLIDAALGAAPLPRIEPSSVPPVAAGAGRDFAEVRGQDLARRAVEIAVAGGHNLLLFGPPGVGKTMIAQRIPSILPPMSHEESLEVTQIYSAVGGAPGGMTSARPFRAPHHTISAAALAGGGSVPRPGEISLAHRGVLFLDELPEFARGAIECLRQPLEERRVRISRVHGTVTLPASFLLVAAANPCPCGWLGSNTRACVCSPTGVERYRGRMSGPLLDRIDLQVRVSSVALTDLRGAEGESSEAIRARVTAARDRQLARGGVLNAELRGRHMRAVCRLTADAEDKLAKLQLRREPMTARGVDSVVRVARTLADLRGREHIDADDIVDAATHRALESEPLSAPRLFGSWPGQNEENRGATECPQEEQLS